MQLSNYIKLGEGLGTIDMNLDNSLRICKNSYTLLYRTKYFAMCWMFFIV